MHDLTEVKRLKKHFKGERSPNNRHFFDIDNYRSKFPAYLLVIFMLLWSVAAIAPYDRFNWFLENILIILSCVFLISMFKSFRLSNPSYLLIMIFLTLHTIGAHYSYSLTPIDGVLNRLFEFERNNYDRIVHFSFGLLLVYPISEVIKRCMKLKDAYSNIFAVISILSAGAFYELIEMWIAKLVAPEIGLMFLGIQGDVWDTQNDIALALYGALLTMMVVTTYKRNWKKA